MSAVKLEEVAVVTKKPVKFVPVVEVAVKSSLDGDKVKVEVDENLYTEQLINNGLTKENVDNIVTFHNTYVKKVVAAVGTELESAYAKHKTATGFEFSDNTLISEIELHGLKNKTAFFKGVEYPGTEMTLKQTYHNPGLKATVSAVRKKLYDTFND